MVFLFKPDVAPLPLLKSPQSLPLANFEESESINSKGIVLHNIRGKAGKRWTNTLQERAPYAAYIILTVVKELKSSQALDPQAKT